MNIKKQDKYERVFSQIADLTKEIKNPISRMATVVAILHHKFDTYFWTGFYLLQDGELLVGPYQGMLACLKLKQNTGVCWAAINRQMPVVVPDVHQFDGHIACSSLSKSEIVVPLMKDGNIVGVFDVDSDRLDAFDQDDAIGITKIMQLIYA